MVYISEMTYDEILDILDVNYVAASTVGYTLQPGIYEISDTNLMLKSSLPDEVKVEITIGDLRLRSNITSNGTKRLT